MDSTDEKITTELHNKADKLEKKWEYYRIISSIFKDKINAIPLPHPIPSHLKIKTN